MKDPLREAIKLALSARDHEIGCDDCIELVANYAELLLASQTPGEAYRDLEHHLEVCGCCREELKALLEALRATKNPA